MEDKETDKTYFSYDQYHTLKTDFTPTQKITWDNDLLKDIFNSMFAAQNKKEWYNDVFIQLKKLLNRTHAFWKNHEDDCCKYINFWLNKEVRKLNYGVNNKDHFKIFIEFMEKYVEKKSYPRCKQKIHFINNDLNLKTIKLYELYDKHEELKKISTSNVPSLCSKYNELVQYYNNFIYQYNGKSSDFLKTKVDKIKSLIEAFKTSNNSCKKDVELLSLEIEKIPSSEEEPRTDIQTVQHKDQPERLGEDGLQPHNAVDLTDQKRLQQGTPEPGPRALTSDQQDTQSESEVIPRRSGNEQNEVNHEGSYFSRRTGILRKGMDSLETVMLPREGEESIARYNEGVIGTMRNAISAFMNGVDPVPVVGVSGGMGALFLLFRYTPVGAFFRGGRGRAHRIPRSFNGQFLGGFPGYEDYEGGYVGYSQMSSLAE
ncbi:VIR protein [Plasmodium vivax]|uniref:VIR protein n=1 Tax=Plasmodium vivax TaxID=5855 RepID=A0A1G4E3U4_PLAVI|nr:VIR protein [Plasmodium vivax]